MASPLGVSLPCVQPGIPPASGFTHLKMSSSRRLRIEFSPCPPPNVPSIQFPRKQGCAITRPSGKSGPLGTLTLLLLGMWPRVCE